MSGYDLFRERNIQKLDRYIDRINYYHIVIPDYNQRINHCDYNYVVKQADDLIILLYGLGS